MTATLDSAPGAEADRPPSAPRDPRGRQRRLLVLLAVVMPIVGGALIVLSHHHAAGLAEPDNTQFALYWMGFFGGMLPLVGLACARPIDGVTRACALAGIGLFGTVPRLLHHRPTGSDEFIHLRQALETYLNGDVGHGLTSISTEFFGLHQVVSAFARLTGLPLWTSGVGVVVLAHSLSVLAVYQLVRNVGVPATGAAVGAVVYILNPSWMYFNIAVSYESLSLPLVLWCLAATVGAGRATEKPALRPLAVAVLCTFALPMIHHLSTIMLLLILTILITARLVPWFPRAAAGTLEQRRERLWPLVLIWLCLLVSIHFWWSQKYDRLINYLGPALSEGFSQLWRILDGFTRITSGGRTLFSNAANPIYEIVAGYMFPFVMMALFLWSVTVLWRNRCRVGPTPWAFAVLGAMFFASMPLVLTVGGAEGAHRSWGYSFIGIAVLCGTAWSLGADSPGVIANRWASAASAFGRPGVRTGVAIVVFIVLAFGGGALGVNVSNRFPGPAHVGDDARSVSNEGRAVAEWLAVHAPVDTPVMADRYVSSQVGSLGRMSMLRPSEGFPLWEIYMNAEPLRPQVMRQIWHSKIRYFVVDSRMATTRPLMGYWFVRTEPGVRGNDLFPQAALDRFDCLPWLRAVYAAGPLTVYEVDTEELERTKAVSCEEPGP